MVKGWRSPPNSWAARHSAFLFDSPTANAAELSPVMTITTRHAADLASRFPARGVIELCWVGVMPAADGDEKKGLESNGLYQRVEVILALQVIDDGHGLMEMWIQTPTRQKQVVPRQPVPCTVVEESDMLHIDAELNGRRAVAISIGADDRLIYARSDLLTEKAGLTGGAYHPPALVRRAVDREAATA